MKLLIAQLKNQDPLQPTDNTQFVTQLAQFSSLQTLQQIQTSLDSSMGAQLLGEAMNLLGRTVTAQPTGSTPVTGVVSGIQLQGANVLLQVGSQTVNLSDVQKVTTSTSQGG
jgi:flagellar basal-body rod modification protein FlgD